MPQPLKHALYVKGSAEQESKQDFVAGLRGFLLNDMAANMKACFETEIEPNMQAANKKLENGEDVHSAIKSKNVFKFYSSMRYNAQEMVWRNALRTIHQSSEELDSRINAITNNSSSARRATATIGSSSTGRLLGICAFRRRGRHRSASVQA